MSGTENLVAMGRAELSIGSAPSEQSRGHACLMDDGRLEILVEAPDGDPDKDTIITFPASSIEAAFKRRLR